MSTKPPDFIFHNGNVNVRFEKPKRGRGVVLARTFEDAGGSREFTLYLDVDEATRLADALDELLERLGA